ncbi:MAG: GAF domain-containing protein, partial [Candidatus Omnitrophica bacterium]|nr:GAF domain-containing protein [Candidatus Omnitrophota bacterium]
MTTAKRFLFLFLSIFILFILILSTVFLLDRQHMKILWEKERDQLKVSVDTMLELLSQDIRTYATDYTYWDDMVDFVKTKDLKWAEENLVVSLDTYNADFVSVYDLEGNLVFFYSKEKIKNKNPLADFDKKRIEMIFKNKPLNNFFLNTEYGLFEISSATIHPSDDPERKTASQGYFFTGRLWDDSWIDKISKITKVNFLVTSSKKEEQIIFPKKEITLILSYILKDYQGQPIAELIGISESVLLIQHNRIRNIQIFIFSLFFFIFFIIFGITEKRWIDKPLYLLNQAIVKKDTSFLKKIKKPSEDIKLLEIAIEEGLKYESDLQKEMEAVKLAQERIKKLNRILTILTDINQLIVRATDRDKLFIDTCRIMVEAGLYRMVWIGLVDKETKLVKPVSWWGYVDGYLDIIKISADSSIPEGRGPTGVAIREAKPYICNDIENDPLMQLYREEALKRSYRSCAVFPLRVGLEIIGVLKVYAEKPHFFEEEEIKLLGELARDLSFAIEYLDKEERRKKQEKNLESAYEQLKLLQSQLVQSAKLASLGQLSAGVAHEINNPLVGVLNNVQLIKMMLEQKKEIPLEELKEIILSIEESGLRCKKIVQNMLSFSRASSQVLEKISLNEIIQNTCSL